MISASVNQASAANLNRTLDRIAVATDKPLPDLMRQTAYWAIIGAVKRTGPGTSSNVRRMPQRYRVRPLVSLRENDKKAYELPGGQIFTVGAAEKAFFYQREGGKIFKTPRAVSSAKKRGFERIRPARRLSRGILYWNKRKNGWDTLAYGGRSRDLKDKRFNIPYHGAAKAGWLHNLGNLRYIGKGVNVDPGDNPQKLSSTTVSLNGPVKLISLGNNADYVSIIGSGSDVEGVRAAENKMLGIYRRQLDKGVRESDR